MVELASLFASQILDGGLFLVPRSTVQQTFPELNEVLSVIHSVYWSDDCPEQKSDELSQPSCFPIVAIRSLAQQSKKSLHSHQNPILVLQ